MCPFISRAPSRLCMTCSSTKNLSRRNRPRSSGRNISWRHVPCSCAFESNACRKMIDSELTFEFVGRGVRIRTGGLLRPRQARYQAALRPDMRGSNSSVLLRFPHPALRLPCVCASRHTNGIFDKMRDMRAEFATVEEAVEDIRQGRMIVLIDDEDRENEGDLAMAAEKITPEAINFMAKYARGLICLP